MEIALHMTGVEDVIDKPRRVGDKVSMNNKRSFKWISARDSARQTTW